MLVLKTIQLHVLVICFPNVILLALVNLHQDVLADDAPQSKSVKDGGETTTEPQKLKGDPSEWPGHLKPFGEGGTTRNVDIYKNFPKPTLFFSDYVAPYIPLLIKNASQNNEPSSQWSNDNYFLSKPQSLTHWASTLNMNFKSFIQRYKEEQLVYEDEIPFFLSDLVPIPLPLLCNPIVKHLSNTMMYVAGGDRHNTITKRNVDTVRCVYAGHQDIVLVSHLEYDPKVPENYQDINVEKVDFVKFPGLAEVVYVKASLKQGDCIYIPPKWYWQINSLNSSKSVDVMWYHEVKQVDEKDCMPSIAQPPPLGKVMFAEGKSWSEAWKDIALHYFSSYLKSVPGYNREQFAMAIRRDGTLFKNITSWNEEYEEISEELFNILDVNKNQNYSLADLDALTPKIVEEMRGHLEDVMGDLQDVMHDQQLELKEDQEKTKTGKLKLGLDKPGQDPKAAIETYINNYMLVLEDVITESLAEASSTGTVPDLKERLAKRQAEIDGDVPFIPRSVPSVPSADKKAAKETAKAKIKAKQDKKEAAEKSENEEEEFSEEDGYVTVDDSEVEEIMADNEEDEEQPASTTVKPKVVKNKEKQKPTKDKGKDKKDEL